MGSDSGLSLTASCGCEGFTLGSGAGASSPETPEVASFACFSLLIAGEGFSVVDFDSDPVVLGSSVT